MTLKPKTYKVTIPEGSSGSYSVHKFIVDRKLSCHYKTKHKNRTIPPGNYTRLIKTNSNYIETCIMSDVPAEYLDHVNFISKARGTVLIVGLGLGLVLKCVASKPEVNSVTVIEKELDVIKLVWNHCKNKFGDKINLIHGDIFKVSFPKEIFFDCAWYDIWNFISAKNIIDMGKIKLKFKNMIMWQGFWCYDECMKQLEEFVDERKKVMKI